MKQCLVLSRLSHFNCIMKTNTVTVSGKSFQFEKQSVLKLDFYLCDIETGFEAFAAYIKRKLLTLATECLVN